MRRIEILDQARAMVTRLSRRERMMVLAAIGVLSGLVALLVVVNVQGAFADHRSRIELKEQGLKQVVQLSSGFQEAQAERQRVHARLQGSRSVSLFSFMENLAKGQGITIANMTPRAATTKGGVTEQSVQVSLEGVGLTELVGIINGIQRSPHMVKVKRLRVRRKFNDKKKVDATLTVATYSLAG